MKLSNTVAYKHLPPRSFGLQRQQIANGHRYAGKQSDQSRAPSISMWASGSPQLGCHEAKRADSQASYRDSNQSDHQSDQHFHRLHNSALTELALVELAESPSSRRFLETADPEKLNTPAPTHSTPTHATPFLETPMSRVTPFSSSSCTQSALQNAPQCAPRNEPTSEPTSAPTSAQIEEQLQRFKQQMQTLAENAPLFDKLFLTAFGTSINTEQLEQLRQRIVSRDFSWLPDVALMSATQLHGSDGAYASESNTVFLNETLLIANSSANPSNTPSQQGLLFRVLVEEIGHAIDQQLNVRDALGDEGALFSALFVGDPVGESLLASYKLEDDQGLLEINDELVSVEHSWLSKELGRVANRASRFMQSWASNLRGFIDFLGNAREAVDALAADIQQITLTVLKRPIEIAVEWKDGLHKAVGHLLQGDIAKATNQLRDAIVNSGQLALSLAPELTAMTLNSLLLTLDRLRGGVSERGLFPEERAYLSHLFGNSIDYDKIIIVTGGFKQQLGMDAHVVGNQIYMPRRFDDGESIFTPENTLTSDGLRLLGHEAAHVWQFQQEGSGYITESLVRQLYDGDQDTYSWYQAVRNGTPFVDMNVERQAEIAALIGVAVNRSVNSGAGATLTLSGLNAAIRNQAHRVSETQFLIFMDAYVHLNPTSARFNEAVRVEMELNR